MLPTLRSQCFGAALEFVAGFHLESGSHALQLLWEQWQYCFGSRMQYNLGSTHSALSSMLVCILLSQLCWERRAGQVLVDAHMHYDANSGDGLPAGRI